jgi:two-component system cell cycle response regulator DivK
MIVLVVDDNERNLRLACAVLGHAGIETLQAATASEAIAVASEHVPDVVLMDIRLPDMDGTQAVRILKDDGRTAAIPVVALTSSAMKGDRERFLLAGFDGYIEKPIDVRAFPGQVRGVVAHP